MELMIGQRYTDLQPGNDVGVTLAMFVYVELSGEARSGETYEV